MRHRVVMMIKTLQ